MVEAMTRHVTVTAERGHRWWVLECTEAGAVGQCKRLSQADAEMREAIAFQLGLPEDSFEIDLDVQLPEEYRQASERAKRLRRQADQLSTEAAAAYRTAARTLADKGLTVRDIGTILDVSYQRAHQLVSA